MIDFSYLGYLAAKRKEFYKRCETDFEFRMNQVDKKLMTMNALTGYDKYVRYKNQVIAHDINGEQENVYEIGIYGELKQYK